MKTKAILAEPEVKPEIIKNLPLEFSSFDAITVPLEGSNLIEASAGTGKTYSIAILVLRLLLEKPITIKEILMVTFTKAAVAELEERIRLFVKEAYKASNGESIADKKIEALVQDKLIDSAEEKERVQQALKDAVLFLDETSVLTIHSFCQNALTEFAFETDQLFGAETLQDQASILDDEINNFWRKHITTIPSDLLRYLIEAGLNRDALYSVIKEHLNGKKYYHYKEGHEYSFCEEDQLKLVQELKAVKQQEEKLISEMHKYITTHRDRLLKAGNSNHHARRANMHLFEHPEELAQFVRSKSDKDYVRKLYDDIIEHCSTCDKVSEDIKAKISNVVNDTICQAINSVVTGLEVFKQRNNLLSFDDMIVNLHKALTKHNNSKLIASLSNKYKAVFVDEFQDTDRLQYEIFQKAFAGNSILFYIGDPKQSIYAFRKADIFTYLKAKHDVDQRFTMNTNYRSANNIISAMNLFFKPNNTFDTFAFEGQADRIDYIEVDAPVDNRKGSFLENHSDDVPIIITEGSNKGDVWTNLTAQIIALLNNPAYTIAEKGKERRIKPSDIGILVRVA